MNEKPKVVKWIYTHQLYGWGLSFGDIIHFHVFGLVVMRTPVSLMSDDTRHLIEMDESQSSSHLKGPYSNG